MFQLISQENAMPRFKPLLSDNQWELIEPLLPRHKPSPKGGRPARGNRECLEGTLWVLRREARWQDPPECFPSPSTCWRALPEWGAGREITDFEEAQEGDFVQLWRWSGSGHNPVFVNWVRNTSGQITGVRYWGSQSSTNGIGYQTESFGTTSGMNRNRFYIGRASKPRDQADYDWALGSATTEGTPSTVYSAVEGWRGY
jgi:hypothetical protein